MYLLQHALSWQWLWLTIETQSSFPDRGKFLCSPQRPNRIWDQLSIQSSGWEEYSSRQKDRVEDLAICEVCDAHTFSCSSVRIPWRFPKSEPVITVCACVRGRTFVRQISYGCAQLVGIHDAGWLWYAPVRKVNCVHDAINWGTVLSYLHVAGARCEP
jgi:hypothetical protein